VRKFYDAQTYAARIAKEMGFQFVGGHQVLYPCGYAYLGRFMGENMMGAPSLVRMLTTVRENNAYALICFLPMEDSDRYLISAEEVMRTFKFTDSSSQPPI